MENHKFVYSRGGTRYPSKYLDKDAYTVATVVVADVVGVSVAGSMKWQPREKQIVESIFFMKKSLSFSIRKCFSDFSCGFLNPIFFHDKKDYVDL